MAVGRVFAEAHVGDDDEAIVTLAERTQRGRNRPEWIESGLASVVLVRWESEQKEPADARRGRAIGHRADQRHRPAHVSR